MLINMSRSGSTLEEQLSSIMDVLAKAAVSEISQLFSEGTTTLFLQITRSLKENEALRKRMKMMRSELFSLRLQTRSNASRAASRFALARANICKPRSKPLGNGQKPLVDHKAVGNPPYLKPSISEASSITTPAEQVTPDIILIKDEEDTSGCRPAEDCDAFGDHSMQRGADYEPLRGELRILSVHGQGEGPLMVDGHDTLFTAAKLEALSSLSVNHSLAKSLDCGERLVCRKERTVQQTPDTILIKNEEDIVAGMPSVEDCRRLRCTTSEEHGDAFGDRSTQQGANSESLHVDAPGSSHMSSHNGELRILSVHGKGEGPLAVDGHDTLFNASELEALSSLSVDHSLGDSLDCGKQIFCRKELTRHRGGRKGRPCVVCGQVFPNNAKMAIHMRTHTGEKPYRCDQCMKRFRHSCNLKIHMRIHSGEKPEVCLQCNASFSDPSNLRRHIYKHTRNGVI
ncbi:zinc finger protein 420-like isoform X1 [Gadus macrocephalus]|uniref:zinc finger protein 420-like isoform X1 n=1 Tax=Gadus macrocephalus TaxID=80720 RepID=UPI0028CB5006|nr:zinc finger protein 420-like isoform X1 [Gadus macrocephalus]